MDSEKMGLLIKNTRKKLGLTQKDIATKLNVTVQAVSKWECGGGCPDISFINDLSKILNISSDELMNGKLNNKNSKIETIINYKYIHIVIKILYVLSALMSLTYVFLMYYPNINFSNKYNFILILLMIISSYIGSYLMSKKNNNNNFIIKTVYFYFILYLLLNLKLIFFQDVDYFNYNFVPLSTILGYSKIVLSGAQSIMYFIEKIMFNFILFMPIAIFQKTIFRKYNNHKMIFIVLTIIVIKELIPFITNNGCFDIDDIILSTIGYLLFYKISNTNKFNKIFNNIILVDC